MRKIVKANEVERELRRLLTYSQSARPSRSRMASELQTLKARIAGGKSYNDYLKEADRDFLREVAKQITSEQGHCQAKVSDSSGGSAIFLTLTGEDMSDMPIDGYATIIHTGHFEVRFDLDLDTVNGKVQEEKVFKIGAFTTDMAAKIVLQHLLFRG
jgi:hypothetical protein